MAVSSFQKGVRRIILCFFLFFHKCFAFRAYCYAFQEKSLSFFKNGAMVQSGVIISRGVRAVAWIITTCAVAAVAAAWWLLSIRRELLKKLSVARSARTQLAVCRKNRLQVVGEAETMAAKEVLARSRDIYRQTTESYNAAVDRRKNRLAAALMGFRHIK